MNTKDITPREFTILHLSDLHIVPHGDKKKDYPQYWIE